MTVPRVGLGYDVHPFGGDGPLVLGGVALDGPGLAGHSDADVVCHAVADALLGPTGLGDLGSLFPASDDRWRGVSSTVLLADVVERVAAAGWGLVNVHVVVAAEQPRLAPHLPAMVSGVSAVLAPVLVDEGEGGPPPVSITAKFGEGVGAVGRAEAIAAWAIALLVRM